MSADRWSDCPKCETDSLREDFEISPPEDGRVVVNYSCGCENCGFETDFTHIHEFTQ